MRPRAPRPVVLAVVSIVLLTAATRPAAAWTTVMDVRVAHEAVRLMPSSLRGILESHLEEISAGLGQAESDEGSAWHQQGRAQKPSCAAARIDELVSGVVAMIDGHRPFSEVARGMGELAHYIGDVNNPLQASGQEAAAAGYATDYAEYVESNIERFPLVFYGWRDAALDSGKPGAVRQFVEQTAARARRHFRHIAGAYAPDNTEPLERRFDVRSLPFGIGSLSYSHAVTDTARVWLHVWRRAHGDVAGTPYLAREMAQGARTPSPGEDPR